VEIRDTLTLDKHSTLQPTKSISKDLELISHSPNALAYSPDGHSLAGCFGLVATIWDIQTGGAIKEMECGFVDVSPKSLVWSLDGTAIGIIFPGIENWTVVTCDIASVKVLTHTVQSPYEPYLWPHGRSIWMVVMSGNKRTINIFEIWPTVTPYLVKSHTTSFCVDSHLSPVMHQDQLLSWDLHTGSFYVYDVYKQKLMLEQCKLITANCFSPCGGLLAATSKRKVHIWELEKHLGYYCQRKEFPLWEALGDTPRGLKFSPTSSSLLISRDGYLEVQPLEGSIIHTPEKIPLIKISSNGTYLVTAFKNKSTIMFINLYTNSSQLLKTNFIIVQLALAGNFLFVEQQPGYSAAWIITVEGAVDRPSDARMMGSHLRFWTNSQIGVVKGSQNIIYYDVETGEELESVAPPPSSPLWEDFYLDSNAIDFNTWPSFSHYDLVECNGHPSKDNLPAPTPWCQGGWLMYPEGEHQHRLWLPTHWRTQWEEAHWLNEIKMLRFTTASSKVVIKL